MQSQELWARIRDNRQAPILIAEIGGNHGGRIDLAKRMIKAAKSAGADLVKFQLYDVKEFFIPDYKGYDGFVKESLSTAAVVDISKYARSIGIGFCATPFDFKNMELLLRLRVPCLKVASGDLTFLPFLRAAAKGGKCVIFSTGGGTPKEISNAIRALRQGRCRRMVLLHCVSSYPARFSDQNLRVIPKLAERFHIPIGFSDHTPGIEASLVAAALGARVIEKHFTIDRRLSGGDNAMSILPEECRALAEGLKKTTELLGRPVKSVMPAEKKILRAMRRGIFAKRPLKAGGRLKPGDLICLRPEAGIPASMWDRVVGSKLIRPLPAGQPLQFRDLPR